MKTTGKLIDIFGDSFSCPCCKYNSDETWLEILEKKYHFTLNNESLHGTGAHWCIEKFMGLKHHGDFLLFCLPDMNRLWLDYIPEEESSTASMIHNFMIKNNFDLPDNDESDYILEQSDRIFKDYESFYTSGLHRVLEVLIVSFIFSKHNKYEKILIWPSSGTGYPFQNYNYTLEIPDNVHIVPKCLNFISHLENKNARIDSVIFFGKDKRNNHLSFENHVIFAEQIVNFFSNRILPNPSEFKKNLYEM